MNWLLTSAGLLTLGAVVFHGVCGQLLVLRQISADQLPDTRLGDGRATLVMVQVAWHFVTLTWLVMGAVLLYLGSEPGGSQRLAAPWMIVAIFTVTLVYLLVVVLRRRGPRGLRRHPGWLMLTAMTILTWLSTT